MSSILNASASGGLVSQGDASATLELQSDGTTKFTVAPTGAYGTLQLATAKAWNWNGLTTNTFLDFTGIPSWTKRITIMFNGVRTSGSLVPIIQIGDSGGLETTGYASTAVDFQGTGLAVVSQTTGFAVTAQQANTYTYTGNYFLALLDAATNTWTISGTILANTARASTSAGSKSLSATLDRLRITTVSPSTDTFNAGTVNIMYEG